MELLAPNGESLFPLRETAQLFASIYACIELEIFSMVRNALIIYSHGSHSLRGYVPGSRDVFRNFCKTLIISRVSTFLVTWI